MGRTACTEPQCLYKGAPYLYLYLYSPCGQYGLYRASVPVQGCNLPLPIPLLPLWTVRPVQSLSACTRVHLTFTYTSTPPVDSTACTESQCLYKGAPYLYHLLTYGLDDPRFETRPRNFSKTSKQVLWPTEPHNQRVAELFYRGKTDGT